jgi:Ni/Co efflux regulator RcnB
MRKLLISVAAIGCLATPSAWAQPDHDHGHGSAPQGGAPAPQEHGGGAHGGAPGGGHPDHGGGPHPQPAPSPAVSHGPNGGGNSGRPMMTTTPNYSRGPGGSGFNRPAPAPNTANNRGAGGGGGGNFRSQGGPAMASRPGGGFNRPSGGGQRHDFHGFAEFHQNFTAARHFHAGAYRRPSGWYSHRWAFGEYLPAAFWARDYWLIDFMDFGLPPPPYGAVWVRVGDDALLIDQDSGEIITVEYGVFY